MRRERFPRHRGLAIPTCITTRACRDRSLTVSFEVSGGEDIPGIPGACVTRNFTYLVRGPLYNNNKDVDRMVHLQNSLQLSVNCADA